jgi:hypothetical protein
MLAQALSSAVLMQSVARGVSVRVSVANQHRAASLIQTKYRMHVCLVNYFTVRTGIIAVQSMQRSKLDQARFRHVLVYTAKFQGQVRARIQKAKFAEMKSSAIAIQHSARSRRALKDSSAAVVQCLVRGVQRRAWYTQNQTRLTSERDFRHLQAKCARAIQRAAVHYFARMRHYDLVVKVQRCVLRFLGRQTRRRVAVVMARVQSAFRGLRTRQASDQAEVGSALKRSRERILKCNALATVQTTLHYRTEAAIKSMSSGGGNMSVLIQSCHELQTTTALSEVCCGHVAASDATAVLLATITCCNRSEPHCKFIEAALLVLRNVVKSDNASKSRNNNAFLTQAVASTPNCAEVLTGVICNFVKHDQILRPAVLILTATAEYDSQHGLRNQENATCVQKLDGVRKFLGVLAAREQKMPKNKTAGKKRKQKPLLPVVERLLAALKGAA